MAKNKIKKSLIKAGSTVAVAMAMSSVISMQARAAEVDGNQSADIPPVETGIETNAFVTNSTVEPAEANEAIEVSNTETAAENTETAENNQQIEQDNNTAAENNESNSGGELADPGLELPDAPEVPDTEGMGAEDYNGAIGGYNKEVDDYNEAVDGYNEGVDDYNSAAEDYDQQAQEKYEEDKAAYDEEKAEHEAAEEQYQEDKKQYEENSQAYDAYLKALKEYEAAQKEYEAKLEQYNKEKTEYEADSAAYDAYLKAQAEYEAAQKEYEAKLEQYNKDKAEYDQDSAEYKAYQEAKAAYDAAYDAYQKQMDQYNEDKTKYEADSQAYQDYLDAKEAYDNAKAEYDKVVDAYEAEDAIYDEVTEYNQQVEDKNDGIEDKNAALDEDLHADAVDNIDGVGEINKGVAVDEDTLKTLNGYEELNAQQSDLLEEAAALDAHAGKDAELGSEAYAEYLAAVEAYNDKVTAFNSAVDAYNEAVEKYNAAVDTYNGSKESTTDSSTGGALDEGTADWGNINITNKTFSHIDVKYAAAAAKDVTVEVDADGNETKTYSDSVTQYEVTGVYIDEDNMRSYGVSYVNNDGSTVRTQGLTKQGTEFRTTSHNAASLDPAEGKVSFYMTLEDEEGTEHGITVNLDATSVYAEGTYYIAQRNDKLSSFVDSKGNKLTKVTIDGVEYYDISGQSVFVISALTCDGMGQSGGNRWGSSNSNLNPDGLDLVLNLQTLIKIHQEDNAQKITYLDYELGKTAQATAPTAPGEFTENEPAPVDPPEAPELPTFDMEEPDLVSDPGEAPVEPTPPEAPEEVTDPGEAPVAPTAPEAPEEVTDPGEAPVAPTAPEAPEEVTDPGDAPKDPGEFDKTEPKAPVPAARLNHAEHLEKLAEKFVAVITEPEIPEEDPTPVPWFHNVDEWDDGLTTILDEEVPLAAAPKTGDTSMLFGAMSLFSLGGMLMLKKKKKD